jgi:hypothetical protein
MVAYYDTVVAYRLSGPGAFSQPHILQGIKPRRKLANYGGRRFCDKWRHLIKRGVITGQFTIRGLNK